MARRGRFGAKAEHRPVEQRLLPNPRARPNASYCLPICRAPRFVTNTIQPLVVAVDLPGSFLSAIRPLPTLLDEMSNGCFNKIPNKLRHTSKRFLAFVRAGPGVFANTA